MSKEKKVMEKIEDAVVGSYEKVENAVTGGYKKVENTVVGGYEKIEDAFVGKYLAKDGESVEDAKKRLKGEQ